MAESQLIVGATDISGLEEAGQVITFFTRLGYTTDLERDDNALLNHLHTGGELRGKILGATHIAHQQDRVSFLDIYLYQLPRITRTLRNEIVKDMKLMRENCLLILADHAFHELEFVYLDRVANIGPALDPTAPSIWESVFDDIARAVPANEPLVRVQRVDRRHPSQVMVRLLHDLRLQSSRVLAQCKLLSRAFDTAETREIFFNNRSLFSNYYLKERLPGESEWLDEQNRASLTQTYDRVRGYYDNAGERLAGLSREECRVQLYEPFLRDLGFIGEQIPFAVTGYDYRFSVEQQDGSETRVVCLVYPWGRLLDDPLTFLAPEEAQNDDDPGENPAATLLAQMRETGAQWGMLSNGKLWRLYSGKARSRSTNYYEIDLEEVFSIERRAAEKAATAFLYFWLFFRRAAFVLKSPQPQAAPLCFLDNVLASSERYARELSASLKERVFAEIFPQLAQGFVKYAQETGLLRADLLDLPEDARNRELAPYFTGTLNFLYRLLFLLYAESRELLPVHDERYSKQSLEALKQEIRDAAGDYQGDSRTQNVERAYTSDARACRLYDHLWKLFSAIDRGDRDLNVPAYRGDIFLTELPEGKPEGELNEDQQIALFLKTRKIPDRSLAFGLDLLARDVDPAKKGSTDRDADRLYFIDYRSLGVRQLGSIYEGLLEFKLRIAAGDMVVIENRVLPANGSGQERVAYGRGAVYIENDLHERKATGSYYTPDYIVKYIVAETVGPMLRTRLDKEHNPILRTHLANYQNAVRQEKHNKKLAELDEATYQRFAGSHRPFVDEFFNLKVLDPAMGSGHFLVDAVDYITDYMVERLRAWKPTPLDVSLKDIRVAIQAEAEAQGVSIDPSLLSEINLLKRQVLKRCIFGVDLNPMATRLARLSLWIDSLTQGAPFSFLDHHLRCGNSLLGVTLETMGQVTQTIFTHDLYAILASVQGFERISRSADETPRELDEARTLYDQAIALLQPHQRVSNLWLSERYGNAGARQAIEFYKTAIIEDTVTSEQRITIPGKGKREKLKFGETDQQQVSVHDLLARARQLAAREDSGGRSFFHWDLEFPEVFFDHANLRPSSTRGFDAIIGNPPYVRQEGLGADKDALADLYPPIASNIADLYTYFIARGHELLHDGARFGMITSNKFMRANYGAGLRALLTGGEKIKLEKLLDFGDLPVFEGATTYPMILLSQKAARNGSAIEYGQIKDLGFLKDDSGVSDLDEVARSVLSPMPASAFSGTTWSLADRSVQAVLDKLQKNSIHLEKWLSTKIEYGIKTGYNEAFIIDQQTRDRLIAADPKSADIIKPLLVGENIKRYAYTFDEQYLIFTRRGIDITRYKVIEQYLEQYREQLEPRPRDWEERKQGTWPGRKPGPYQWYEIQDNIAYYADFEKPKIIYQEIATYQRFAFVEAGFFTNNKCFIIPTNDLFLLALLNSRVIWFWLARTVSKLQGGALALQEEYLVHTPIRRINATTPANERDSLRERGQRLYRDHLDTDNWRELLKLTQELLARQPEAADVVRDLLAFLAETMLRLNTARQEQEKALLDFIERAFKVSQQLDPKSGKRGLDAFANKTTLFDYAGEYQKGTPVKALSEIQEVLRKNRGRCLLYGGDFDQALRALAGEYEPNKARLEQLKEHLKATDELLDQIVYQLYGLTSEEIALVEGMK